MTAQVGEFLMHEGRCVTLFSEPLEAYFVQHPPRPDLPPASSANWRGYVGSWLVEDNKLFLVRLSLGLAGMLEDEAGPRLGPGAMPTSGAGTPAGRRNFDIGGWPPLFHRLVAGDTDKIFASWFTGELVVPEGEMLEYVHMGFDSKFERELRMRVTAGVITEAWTVDNRGQVPKRLAEIELTGDFAYHVGRASPRILVQLIARMKSDPNGASSLLNKTVQRDVFNRYLESHGPEDTANLLRALLKRYGTGSLPPDPSSRRGA